MHVTFHANWTKFVDLNTEHVHKLWVLCRKRLYIFFYLLFQIGPASVGMDFSFVGFNHVYGIPEHGDVFPLRNTKYVINLLYKYQ